jgi:hypothetical protein
LLDAIAALGEGQPAAEASTFPAAALAGQAERRHLTEMLSDPDG